MNEYQIGYGINSSKIPVWIGFRVNKNSRVEIAVCVDIGRYANGPVLEPKEMLEFRPHIFHDEFIDGKWKMVGMEQEPPGWFARRCEEANCLWFVPMVERMAAGEEVSLEEIESAYRRHNDGKEMPKGTWGELQSRGQV